MHYRNNTSIPQTVFGIDGLTKTIQPGETAEISLTVPYTVTGSGMELEDVAGINDVAVDEANVGFTIEGGTTPKLLTVDASFPTSSAVKAAEVVFTETAGAGTYTGSIVLPAGATILDIKVKSTALWAADTAAMDVGDVADPNGFYAAINLKATDLLVDEEIRFESTGGKEGAYIVTATGELNNYSASARTITGTIVTTGVAGATGRTRMMVIWTVPTPSAATKA